MNKFYRASQRICISNRIEEQTLHFTHLQLNEFYAKKRSKNAITHKYIEWKMKQS